MGGPETHSDAPQENEPTFADLYDASGNAGLENVADRFNPDGTYKETPSQQQELGTAAQEVSSQAVLESEPVSETGFENSKFDNAKTVDALLRSISEQARNDEHYRYKPAASESYADVHTIFRLVEEGNSTELANIDPALARAVERVAGQREEPSEDLQEAMREVQEVESAYGTLNKQYHDNKKQMERIYKETNPEYLRLAAENNQLWSKMGPLSTQLRMADEKLFRVRGY